MQILPETAYFIAHRSGGTQFTASDLATPSINVAYGSYYLRYLLDHYNGDEMLAVAAYNAGLANVDRWVAQAKADGGHLTVAQIPFPETQAYVERVLSAQQDYRSAYARQLGLDELRARLDRLRAGLDALATVEVVPEFKLDSVFTPTADQPKAIAALAEGVEAGERFQTLLGATGTGKTMAMAGVIEAVQHPTLVIAHNKTLAAQLCNEFRTFFPDNSV
jgi:RecG-like helicase